MSYKCKICGFYPNATTAMCSHIADKKKKYNGIPRGKIKDALKQMSWNELNDILCVVKEQMALKKTGGDSWKY